MAGRIVNFEIPADDIAQATAFWGGLFGWDFRPVFPEASGYLMAGEGIPVAISAMRPGERGPVTYLDVDDIDASIGRVAELGGTAGEKMPVPGMGWFVVCTDPHGNTFGLWQNDADARMG